VDCGSEEGNGKSVLVVEERTLYRPGLHENPNRGRVSSGHCGEWRDCLRDVAKEKTMTFVLAISDTEMNGIELYRQLESECPEAVYKFIFTTGDMLSGNIKTFLKKPGGHACLSHLPLRTSEQ